MPSGTYVYDEQSNEVVIFSESHNDYIKLVNISNDGKIFDIVAFNGQDIVTVSDAQSNFNVVVESGPCVPCWVSGAGLISEIMEVFTPAESINCGETAEDACGAGNVQSVTSEVVDNWFGETIACEFECR
ncbi:hypothetical protein I5168_02660 [Nonlabens sp. SCSIO 43208]|uniref:hypothetical protein n=1 Tax=Nonlabens sp. SCSIO 43208 TaxID=2793009 RepID=UPI003D6A3D1B